MHLHSPSFVSHDSPVAQLTPLHRSEGATQVLVVGLQTLPAAQEVGPHSHFLVVGLQLGVSPAQVGLHWKIEQVP